MAGEFLKYFAMIPMISANASAECKSFTSSWYIRHGEVRTAFSAVESINNSDLVANIKRSVMLNAVRVFEQNLNRLKDVIGAQESHVRAVFSRATDEIITLSPTNLIVGLTDSNSIYFRIYSNAIFETHLEVFYTDDDNDGIEAVATVYKSDDVLIKTFGSLDDVMAKVRNAVSPSQKIVTAIDYAVPSQINS
jgi:hypothetical protein